MAEATAADTRRILGVGYLPRGTYLGWYLRGLYMGTTLMGIRRYQATPAGPS
jgi:hypothetical protein